MDLIKYQQPIEKEFEIVNKDRLVVPMELKPAQVDFLKRAKNRNVILKARQLGFSSLILAIFTSDFIFKQNQQIAVISHESGATQKLMDRVKFFIKGFEKRNGIKVPLKYNSKSEMVNAGSNNSFYIGTAGSKDFGRGDTLTNLLLSEFAFYLNPESLLAGVLQALVPDGKLFIETTANGFNFFKQLWNECESGERSFVTHFYNPSWEYSEEFLAEKRKELKRLFSQEYPMTPEEAFLTSGECYFDTESLRYYLEQAKEPLQENLVYV